MQTSPAATAGRPRSRRRWLLVGLAACLGLAVVAVAVLPMLRPAPIARFRAERLSDDARTFHWRWTIEDGRRWEGLSSRNEGRVQILVANRVGDSSGAFAPWERGLGTISHYGADTFVVEVEAHQEGVGTSEAKTLVSIRQEGRGAGIYFVSDGSRYRPLEPGGRGPRYEALARDERRVRLPARIPLAVIDGERYELELR